MADNYIQVSHLNPFNVVDKNRTLPANYNFKHFDAWLAHEQKLELEQGPCYVQKWQQDDIIFGQVEANYDPIYVKLRNSIGQVVYNDLMTNEVTINGKSYFQFAIALDTFPEGVYKKEIVAGDPVQTILESETMEIREQWPGTLLIKYSNNFNNNIIWQTGIYFNLRVEGVIPPIEFTPTSIRTVYVDQPDNAKTVKGRAARTFKLFLGQEGGIPPWMADKIEEIFDQNNVDIDGKPFSAIEGAKLTGKKIERYYLASYEMEIREAINRRSKRFQSTGITEQKIAMDYVVEGKLFGPVAGSANNNTYVITEIE